MEFIFECSNRYLTRSLRSLVRYRFEHKKINSISPSVHVFFCLLYKQIPDVYVQQFYCKMKKKTLRDYDQSNAAKNNNKEAVLQSQ